MRVTVNMGYGMDQHCERSHAQIRTSRIPAYGSYFGSLA